MNLRALRRSALAIVMMLAGMVGSAQLPGDPLQEALRHPQPPMERLATLSALCFAAGIPDADKLRYAQRTGSYADSVLALPGTDRKKVLGMKANGLYTATRLAYDETDPRMRDSLLAGYSRAEALSLESGNDHVLGGAIERIVNLLLSTGNTRAYDSLLAVYRQAEAEARSTGTQERARLTAKRIGMMQFHLGYRRWRDGRFDLALDAHREAARTFKEIGDTSMMDLSLQRSVHDLIDAGNYVEARQVLRELEARHERRRELAALSWVHSMRGYILSQEGDLAGLIQESFLQLRIDEQRGDLSLVAMDYSNIGDVELQMGHPAEALGHYNQALVLWRRIGAAPDMNVALTHSSIGDAHRSLHKFTDAMAAYQQALAIGRKLDEATAIGVALMGMARVHDEQGDEGAALDAYEQAAEALRRGGFEKVELVKIYARIGMLHARAGQVAEGQRYLQRIDSIAGMINSRSIQADLNRTAELLDSMRGDWRNAYLHSKRYIIYRDSIYGEENREAIAKAQVRYESEKQMLADSLTYAADKAIQVREIQKQKVVRNGFMLGFAFVVVFAVVFLFQRNRIQKEHARSEELLLNILPQEVAEELKAKGEAEAVQIDQVTVLFTDFKGFTAMSEKLTPRQLVHDLHECFSAFDRIAEKHGVEKIKTIGDAYMAAGGVPDPSGGMPVAVVLAGLEMQQIIKERQAERKALGRPTFEMRVGIHTGPVVAGIVGRRKFQYDIWGDTVNIASRMETTGEPGEVNISSATYERVKNAPELLFTPRGLVEAKGKGGMAMYYVRARSIQAIVDAEPLEQPPPAPLPAAIAADTGDLKGSTSTAPVSTLRDLRILLAEDNEFNALVAQGHLEDWLPGTQLTHVVNGALAVEAARTGDHDVVLMDIQMPEMNGYDATRAIRALPGDRSRIPIIAMSANVMKAEMDRCTEAGMNAFVPKPYKKEQLLSALERVLNAHKVKA